MSIKHRIAKHLKPKRRTTSSAHRITKRDIVAVLHTIAGLYLAGQAWLHHTDVSYLISLGISAWLGAALVLLLTRPRPVKRSSASAGSKGRGGHSDRGRWPTVPGAQVLDPVGAESGAPRKPERLTPQRRTRAKLAAALELANVRGYGADLADVWDAIDETEPAS